MPLARALRSAEDWDPKSQLGVGSVPRADPGAHARPSSRVEFYSPKNFKFQIPNSRFLQIANDPKMTHDSGSPDSVPKKFLHKNSSDKLTHRPL